MDYQEIVDQYISNENEYEPTEITENDQKKKSEEFSSLSTEKKEEEKGSSTIDITDDNDTLASNSRAISKSFLLNEELAKIHIHMKSLIKARQQTRQTFLLQKIKQRNGLFTEFKTAQEKEFERNREKIKLEEGMIKNKIINNERRRAILKQKDKNEDEIVKTVNTVEMEIETNNDEENNNSNTDKKLISKSTYELIPCRLELDYDGYRLSDVLLLPTRPTTCQKDIEAISIQLCQDYDLPLDLFQGAIAKCLRDQVEEWDVYQGAMEGMKIPFDEIGAVPLRLDVIVGLHRFEDQLEVSLDPLQSTFEVMHKFVEALKSPDDRILSETNFIPFKPLILHNLLEQLMLWRRAIVFGGFHRDGRSNNLKFHDGDVAVLLNDVNSLSGSGPVSSVRRHFAHTNTFTPILSTLTIEELEKIEAGRERESRRRRRTTGIINSGPVSGKRGAANLTTTSSSSATTTTVPTGLIVNNLSGTVRSPPRTLPTPTSYRGNLYRIRSQTQQFTNSTNNVLKESDEDESIAGPAKKRQQRGRKGKGKTRS